MIEARSIPTVSVTVARDVTEKIKAPRAIFLPWSMGHHFGVPFNRDSAKACDFGSARSAGHAASVRNDSRCPHQMGGCAPGGEDPHGTRASALAGFGIAPVAVFDGCSDERAACRTDQDHAPVPDHDVKHIHVRAVELQHTETGQASQTAYRRSD